MLRREALALYGRRLAETIATRRTFRPGALECLVTLWEVSWRPGQGEELETTWEAMFAVLRQRRPWRGPSFHPGWSAATFAPLVRTMGNARSVAALVLHVERAAGLTTLDTVAAGWGDFYGLVQTTNRHSPHALDALIVLPYARAASLAEHVRVVEWARGRNRDRGLPEDANARNPARWAYLPGTVPGDPFETRELGGSLLDPSAFGQSTNGSLDVDHSVDHTGVTSRVRA